LPFTWYKKFIFFAGFLALLGIPISPTSLGRIVDRKDPMGRNDPVGRTERAASARGPALVLALHWEGRDMLDMNLGALAELRAQFDRIPMIHFISPAYFLRSPQEAQAARQKIRTLMRSGDQVGLALGGWKSLVVKADAIFRPGPTFWGYELRPEDCLTDCGQDIPVHIYPEEELHKIMSTSAKVLEDNGFGKPRGLAVTGWVASPQVLEAAARIGISHDFSAVPMTPIQRIIASYPLHYWVRGLWPQPAPQFQTFPITTQTSTITEVPQSIPGMDYATVTEALKTFTEFKTAADGRSDSSDKGMLFHLVIHQETAHITAPRVQTFLKAMLADHAVQKQPLTALVVPGMGVAPEEGAGPLVH
jgi:hypothetical protein